MRRTAGILDEWEPRSAGRKRRLAAALMGLAAAAGGFVLGVWATGASQQEAAAEAAARAREQLAAAVCAYRFMEQNDARERLAEVIQAGLDERGELVARGGWATMPDRTEPDAGAAQRCALKLGEAYTSVQKATPMSAP